MEVNRLLDAELTYEILIRGYPAGGTVDQKRATLRQLLRLEREGAASAPASVALNAFDELELCSAKLSGLEGEIRFFNFENRKNEFQRLYTRLLHVTLRLGRITPEDEQQSQQREELISKGRKLIGDLNLAYDGVPYVEVSQASARSATMHDRSHVSLLDTENPLLPEVLHSYVSNRNNPELQNPLTGPNPNYLPETPLIPELVVENPGDNGHRLVPNFAPPQQQPVASSSRVLDIPIRNDYEFPTRVTTIPTTSASVYSSSQQREALYGRQLPSNFPVGHAELHSDAHRTASRVHFARSPDRNLYYENWSRVPNNDYFSSVNDTLPLGTSESLANRLADIHFSPANVNSLP